MRERWLLVLSALLVLAGVAAALVRAGDDHVGPAACARRVARALHFDVIAEPSIERRGADWTATVPSTRVIVRVTGTGHEVTDVEALTGPGADLLERPQRLIGLAVRC